MDANLDHQRRLYGEPLADIVARITRNLGLNQAQTARSLGLSAPMLSHLVSGRRVKIGNPQAAARLHALNQLALDAEAGAISRPEVTARIEAISASEEWGDTTTRTLQAPPVSDDQMVAAIQALFRQVASAEEWLEIVTRLRSQHPRVAELLHAYGLARTAEAVEHWRRALT